MSEPAAAPTPHELVLSQGGVLTSEQLRAALGPGPVGSAALRRAVRAKDWHSWQRGTYTTRQLAELAATDPRIHHQLDCAARVLLSGRDLVVSHQSAALLHRLPLLDAYAGQPQLTLVRPLGDPPAHVSGLLAAAVPSAHRQVLRGLPVTSRPRTVADLARTLPPPAALVMADAALRAGVRREDVLDVLGGFRRWPGADAGIDTMLFADRRAESALESLARLWFRQAGLPRPKLQIRLCDASNGLFVGRVDFFWPELRTVCEVDGRVKYELDADSLPEHGVLWQEKLREDTLRELGLEVVRGYWSDGRSEGQSLVDRVRRAFARADQRTDRPSYGILT